MDNIFEPHAGFKAMLTPPAPNINVELGMGGDLGVRILLSTQAPWIATSPNINLGVRGASCDARFEYIVHVRSFWARLETCRKIGGIN